jgi:NAD(P)H-flavin reductase
VPLLYVGLAGVIAIASRFVLAYKHKHIFNPAALAAVVLSLTGLLSVTWWIGNPFMLPFVLTLGLLIVRKSHRFNMVFVFTVASLLILVLIAQITGQETHILVKNAIFSGPLIFFCTIMLTEPATLPTLPYYQLLYGALVGALYASQLRYGILSSSPQMVLLAGNVFAYIVNPKVKLRMQLKERIQISKQVYDFVFTPDKPLKFIPGQYMEWTLGHSKVDSRGNRRSFSIASSPTEIDVHLGIKLYENPSSFKAALMNMKVGDKIAAGQIAGNFIMPSDITKKLVFIAGGVGITPFRSMVKYLVDTGQYRDITLLYFVNSPNEIAYRDIFKYGGKVGVRLLPVVNKRLTPGMLSVNIPAHVLYLGPQCFGRYLL